ncbi:hypothetical protein GCM10019016_136760 [Streptomyces prasinosporus]|uniref:DUF1015 family protein n=1 Tax=Streptomyces prasinosporus TaxID=68256 RepID=A0ABP6UK17_9ACTN
MNSAGHSKATAPRGLELTPFRGLRYDPDRVGSLAAVTSPPYDVVVRPDGLHHLQSADPYNIVRLILPEAGTPAERNAQAAETLRRWRAEGVLTPDPEPGLYVYEQRDGDGLVQRGCDRHAARLRTRRSGWCCRTRTSCRTSSRTART